MLFLNEDDVKSSEDEGSFSATSDVSDEETDDQNKDGGNSCKVSHSCLKTCFIHISPAVC